MDITRKVALKILNKLADKADKKYAAELTFWKGEIENYKNWYEGKLSSSYGTVCPNENEKVIVSNLKDSAILTWHKKHQEKKYLADLQLAPSYFQGKRILDVGSGPIPSATCFEGSDLYCLEPLLDQYLSIGFPIHYYGDTKFIKGRAEEMPVVDNFFDGIVSVNAMDHVDNFEATAAEIQRVLKPRGLVRFHLHYHYYTVTEPVELNDDRVAKAFSGIKGFRKISEKKDKYGSVCEEGESYVLWTNMPDA